jgi:hypothetical protein
MNQIVVDTDIDSYIFNWHASAPRYANALRGSQLILSFMSIAEMRKGLLRPVGAFGGAPFSNSSLGASAPFMPTTLCVLLGRGCGPRLERQDDR